MSKTIRVLLADDHPALRAGIRTIMEKAPDIQVVGEAEDGTEAQQLTADLRPQVLLLDLRMPGPRPVETVAWVRAHCPETAVLVHQHSPCLLTIPPQSRRPSPLQARLISYVRRRIWGATLFAFSPIYIIDGTRALSCGEPTHFYSD